MPRVASFDPVALSFCPVACVLGMLAKDGMGHFENAMFDVIEI